MSLTWPRLPLIRRRKPSNKALELSLLSVQDQTAIRIGLQEALGQQGCEDAILQLRGQAAQFAVDCIQESLGPTQRENASNVDGLVRDRRRRLLTKLSLESGQLPSSLFLQGIVCPERERCRAGGFADIYRGKLGQQVIALKVLRVYEMMEELTRKDSEKAFYHEALMWHTLDHPHILPFLGIDNAIFKNALSMVLPWMEAGSIRDVMNKRKTDGEPVNLLYRSVHNYLLEIALGLEYLHNEKIVHGDLRGANILIDAIGAVRLTDFGLAVFSDGVSNQYASARGGAVRWLAPELVDCVTFGTHSSRPTFDSDVYAFACVCIELFICKAPFTGHLSDHQVLVQVPVGVRPSRPSFHATTDLNMSDALWSLVSSCWSHVPSLRPLMESVVKQISQVNDDFRNQTVEMTRRAQELLAPECSRDRPFKTVGQSVADKNCRRDAADMDPAYEMADKRAERMIAETEALRVSKRIDEEIRAEKTALQNRQIIKVLLLGQRESGKSTTVKNFRMMYARDAWEKERASWRFVVVENLAHNVRSILDVLAKALGDDLAGPSSSSSEPSPDNGPKSPMLSTSSPSPLAVSEFSEKHRLLSFRLAPLCSVVIALGNCNEFFESEERRVADMLVSCAEDIKMLWEDEIVREMLKRNKAELDLMPGFFIEDVDRIANKDYVPSDDDIMKAQLHRAGVREYKILPDKGTQWILYNVPGGTQRMSIFMPFFDCDVVIFLAPVSCFDETLPEDRRMNRLEDSFSLWKTMCSSKLLVKTHIILFLNKCDLLEKKLQRGVRVRDYVLSFGDRKNEKDVVIQYFWRHFEKIAKQSSLRRAVRVFRTSVVDTKATASTLGVVEGVMREHLGQTNLIR